MAYDNILDAQREIFILGLGGSPGYYNWSHLQLMFRYLEIVEGRNEPTLLERLYGWALANNIPMTLAATRLGF